MAISKITSDAIDATDFNLDSNTLTVDATNNRVGIGLADPDTPLEVQLGSSGNAIKLSSRTDGVSVFLAFEQQESGTKHVRGRIRAASNGVDGGLIFETGASSSTSERMRMLSGGGITFNGDTATANALDDYEEGTFTPAYAHTSGGSFTHNIQLGRYTKIGRVVHCTGRVRGALTSSGSGAVNVTGFPFTSASTANLHASGAIGRTGNFNNAPKSLFMGTNSTLMAMRQNNSSSSPKSNVSDDTVSADMDTGTSSNDLIFSISYMTD